jgi:hypothetical protein
VIPEGITINFFVFPKLADVLRYNSCLPDNLPQTEFNFAAIYLIPFYSTLTGILGAAGGLVSGLPSTPVDTGDLFHSVMGSFACGKDNAINSALAIANLYGVVGVAAYIMPLLNLIIVISAAVGISGLLGGDTDIIGLSKLL